MISLDWSIPAKLIERDDSGSELAFDFCERKSGTLAELVATVVAMNVRDRARMIIDAGPQGMMTIAQILALATRTDFPG